MNCYLCDEEATSDEHCPAQSYFPKDKRVNLITVPSCPRHNEETSLDDEYVRNIIAMTKGNNDVGASHFKDKGLRSLQRSPGLFNTTIKNPKQLNFIKGDESSKTMAVEVDRNRFNRVIRKISYGLYYHKFKQTWNYGLGIAAHNLVTDNLDTDPIAERLRFHSKPETNLPYEGTNQDVFKFVFLHFTFSPHKILAMKFYDWFDVWAIPKESSTAATLND